MIKPLDALECNLNSSLSQFQMPNFEIRVKAANYTKAKGEQGKAKNVRDTIPNNLAAN